MQEKEFPLDGMYGCEVGGTITTTGVRIYCLECKEWFDEWTSRQKYPRLQELINSCRMHIESH